MKSRKLSDATKQKISDAKKGVKKTDEAKAKMRAAQQARHASYKAALALVEQVKAQQKIVAVVPEEVKNEQ